MAALKPEDCDNLMAKAIQARDLEAAVALYEMDAAFVLGSGETVTGHDAVREALRPFMSAKNFEFTKRPVAFISAQQDLALLRGSWSAEVEGADGQWVTISGHDVEVVRRQADGTWLFVIDHPTGAN